jgi:hypothetical protein
MQSARTPTLATAWNATPLTMRMGVNPFLVAEAAKSESHCC